MPQATTMVVGAGDAPGQGQASITTTGNGQTGTDEQLSGSESENQAHTMGFWAGQENDSDANATDESTAQSGFGFYPGFDELMDVIRSAPDWIFWVTLGGIALGFIGFNAVSTWFSGVIYRGAKGA